MVWNLIILWPGTRKVVLWWKLPVRWWKVTVVHFLSDLPRVYLSIVYVFDGWSSFGLLRNYLFHFWERNSGPSQCYQNCRNFVYLYSLTSFAAPTKHDYHFYRNYVYDFSVLYLCSAIHFCVCIMCVCLKRDWEVLFDWIVLRGTFIGFVRG